MRKRLFLGPVVTFAGAFLATATPPDPISQLIYGCIAVVLYAIIAAIAAALVPAGRNKKNGLWLALGVSLVSIVITAGGVRLLLEHHHHGPWPDSITTCSDGQHNLQVIIAAKGTTLWGVLAAPIMDETGRQFFPLREVKFTGEGQVVIDDATITFNPQQQMLTRNIEGITALANLPQNAIRIERKSFVPDFKAFAQATLPPPQASDVPVTNGSMDP